ncbi:MAG: flagellar filament outer layer protein FlaA, partial [Spirochaetaceae bacterium]
VQGSKFVTEGFPQYGYVNSWPDGLYRRAPEGVTLRSLGARAQFDRLGYNYLEFIPVEQGEDGELVSKPVSIPGRAESMDFWVWGSNHDYYIEVHVRDHRGVVHTLQAGNLNYIGWQNLQVKIPNYIPQGVQYVPMTRSLELVKIVMWTRPTERVDGFEIYLDHITVLTDLHEEPFDGEELADPDRLKELWEEAQGSNF